MAQQHKPLSGKALTKIINQALAPYGASIEALDAAAGNLTISSPQQREPLSDQALLDIINSALAPYSEAIVKLDKAIADLQKAVPALQEHGNEVKMEKVLEYESGITAMRSLLDQIGGEMDEVML